MSSPYIAWALIFIVVPLCMVIYYGLTDSHGDFTFSNIATMAKPGYLKALRRSIVLALESTVVCFILALLSIFPFWIMIVNSTRSTVQIQQHALSLVPSTYLVQNFKILTGKSFNPFVGLANSLIISTGVTVLTLYFSSLTAYALVAYEWKLKNAFFKFIIGVMMIPDE